MSVGLQGQTNCLQVRFIGYSFIFFCLVEICTLFCNLLNLFYSQTDQGVKNVPADRAGQLAGSDPDYNNRKLYNAIADGNPVS